MNKDRYDYFVLAYDSPNFSAAAAKVPMTPQGFTKTIRALEAELGVPLFEVDKDGRRRPTAYADELYEFATHMQAERNLLQTRFDRIADQDIVTIDVVASLGLVGMFGSKFFRRYAEDHPGQRVHVVEVPDTLCDQLLHDGMCDLGLVITPIAPDLHFTPLFSEPVELWLRDDDPLAAQESVSPADLCGRTLACPGEGFKAPHAITQACTAAGGEAPKLLETSEIFWIYEQVHRGKAVGFTLPHLRKLHAFTGDEHIVTRPLSGMQWTFGIAHLKGHALTEAEDAFIAEAKALIKKRHG